MCKIWKFFRNYMRELQIQKIVSPDTIHYLFGNLNALVDFQRRFLIQLEEIAEKTPEEQRVGSLFIQMEELFSVYEPYCANYYSAQDLVVQETPRLQKLADILNPTYQLPSMLIKPVQRICKYPLLLQELVKSTDKDWPFYQEAHLGLEAIKRVTERVNETQRQHENLQAIQNLKKRLEYYQDLSLDGYGKLLLQDKLTISASDNDREYFVFLFDRTILVCKESKGSNLPNTLTINKKKRRGSLVPKMVFQTSCMHVQSSQLKNGIWSFQADLTGCPLDQITFKFRNEEQLKLWSSTLSKAIQKAIEELVEFDEKTQFASPYSDYEEEDEFLDDEEDEPPRGKLSQPHRLLPGMNLSPLPRTYFPATPPPSYPPSPTVAAQVTTHPEGILLKTGRSQSQSAAMRQPLPIQQNRLRSKSSPNIMTDEIKVKLVFNEGVYAITTHAQISYLELMEKVDKKIRLVANLPPANHLRLKYQDEDGDLITINSNDDVQMAFESKPTTLFVNL